MKKLVFLSCLVAITNDAPVIATTIPPEVYFIPCPTMLITFRYLINLAEHIPKQAEILSQVELKRFDRFQDKIDELTNKTLKLEEEVQGFSTEDGFTSCLPSDWEETLTRLQIEASNATKRMWATFEERKAAMVTQVIQEIQANRPLEAYFIFLNLSESLQDREVAGIMEAAYANKSENVEKCAKFLWKLPPCHQDAIGFRRLFELMEANNGLNTNLLLLFSGKGTICDDSMKEVEAKVKPHTAKIIKGWAESIQGGDYSGIIREYKKRGEILEYPVDTLNTYLPDLVDYAYDRNLNNFQRVLDFIKNIPSLYSRLDGYPALYNELRKKNQTASSEMLELIYIVKHEYFQGYPWDSWFVKLKFKNFKKSVPEVLWRLIWIKGSNTEMEESDKLNYGCHIISEKNNEALYVIEGKKTEDEEQALIRKSTAQINETLGSDQLWEFQMVDGKNSSFYIVNRGHNANATKYLTLDTSSKPETTQVKIVIASNKENGIVLKRRTWIVEPHNLRSDGKIMGVSLQNTYNNFYLTPANEMAFEDDSNRAKVFMKPAISAEMYWKILCK